VRLPLTRMGELAASMVLTDGEPGAPRIVPVPGEVIVRDSTLPRGPRG
jgi:LacI family transcriptional regulator